jgi:SAM-dependent methyltransferase
LDDPLKQAKAKAAATYDAAADHFDDEPLQFWERIGSRTVARLGLSAGAHVLDVGCGTGASALPAAQAVGRDGFVVGVDLAARLLDRARAKAHELPKDLVGKGEILLDPKGELHHRYGARDACLYVVRPDGYIGFRSQPPDLEALKSYYTQIFL